MILSDHEVDGLIFTLKSVEWEGKRPGAPSGWCPGCYRSREDGHFSDCVIGFTLKSIEQKLAPLQARPDKPGTPTKSPT